MEYRKKITFKNTSSQVKKTRLSELSQDNNYEIISHIIEPKLTYQKGSSFRTSILSAIKNKKNMDLYGGEKAEFRKIGLEITYNFISKGRISGGVDYISTFFSGEQGNSSPLLFDMLEGFQIGTNYTWKTSYQRAFKNNFQINLIYEGRASEEAKTVHTGNVQVQLLF